MRRCICRQRDRAVIFIMLLTLVSHSFFLTRDEFLPHCKYDGALLIQHTDMWSGFSTVFFQLIISQLVYADRHNLLPIIHLGNSSLTVHDPVVHGVGHRQVIGFAGSAIPNTKIPKVIPDVWYPGHPRRDTTHRKTTIHLAGTGLWNHYFHDLHVCDTDNLQIYSMAPEQVSPGLFFHAPWSPKAWRYDRIPDIIQKRHLPLFEWLQPQRQVASKIVQKYYRIQPSVLRDVQRSLPVKECLGLHIRWSDKKIARRILRVDEFLPFVQAYSHHHAKPCIYLATDSWLVWEEIQAAWPQNLLSLFYQQSAVLIRSNDTRHVADLGSHHNVNHQTLVDIVALSRCSFLIHGHSAVSESAMYLNPALFDRSINLEDPDRFIINATDFVQLIHSTLPARPTDWWNQGPREIPQCHVDSLSSIQLAQRDADGYVLSPQQFMVKVFVELVHQLVFQQKALIDPIWFYWFDALEDCFVEWTPTTHKELWNATTKTLLASVRTRQNYGTTSTAKVDFPLVRQLMHDVLSSTLQPRPFLTNRVPQESHCLGLWIEDPGYVMQSKNLIPRDWPRIEYYKYISAFQKAGGTCLYVATESSSIYDQVTGDWKELDVYSQARAVRNRRATKAHWMIDRVEQVGSETLLDIFSLALVCDVLIHAPHSIAEAALYWNPHLISVPIVGSESATLNQNFERWLYQEKNQSS